MWFCCWARWSRFHLKTVQTCAVVYKLTLLLVCVHLENKPHLQFHDVTLRNKHKFNANSTYQHLCLFVFAAFLVAILGWNANSFEHTVVWIHACGLSYTLPGISHACCFVQRDFLNTFSVVVSLSLIPGLRFHPRQRKHSSLKLQGHCFANPTIQFQTKLCIYNKRNISHLMRYWERRLPSINQYNCSQLIVMLYVVSLYVSFLQNNIEEIVSQQTKDQGLLMNTFNCNSGRNTFFPYNLWPLYIKRPMKKFALLPERSVTIMGRRL